MIMLGVTLLVAISTVHGEPASEWRQHSLGYVEVEHQFVGDGPVINSGQSAMNVPADDGEVVKTQEIMGAGTQNPPAWDSRFTPLKTPAVNVSNPWSHDDITLQPRFGFEHRSIWRKSQGWQQFERYDDGEPTGLMLRRDRDWWEPYGEEEHIWEAIQPGGGGGAG